MVATETISPSTAVQPVIEGLRSLIESLGEGAKLPTVRVLMRDYGVGQAIVQQAVEALEVEGLVTAEVGRGTFVRRSAAAGGAPGQWSVVILNHEKPGRRDELIASGLHRQLLAAKHRSVIITYSDLAHAADLVRSMPAIDACVIRLQSDVLPAGILANIQSKCRAVVVEGVPMEHVDVDSVVTDWLLSIETAIRHLRSRRHTRIGLALDNTTARYAREGARLFRSLMRLVGSEDAPVVYRSEDGAIDAQAFAGCTAVIAWGAFIAQSLRDSGATQPLVILENSDLNHPAMTGSTIVGRPTDRVATAVIERIEYRLKNPGAAFAPVYDKPKLLIPS